MVTPNSGVGLPLADLKLWLKADSGVVRNNTNGTVGSWIDQSGNGNNATTLYLSDQPQWLTNSASGGPAVRFDGVSDHFILPGFLTGATQAEAYVILRAATNLPSSSRGLWRFGPQSGASSYYPHYNGHIYDSFGSTINRDLGIPLHRADEFHLYNANAGAAQWNSWINGRSFYTTNVNTVSFPSDPMIGDAWNSEFAGDMVEVMIFKRGLSIEERCSVGRYLNYKYQFANSPPSSVRATAQSSTQLSISWNDNGSLDPTSYTVDRKTGATGSYLQIAAVTNGFLCLDSSVVPGTNYYYRVTGSNFFGDSFSTEISPPTVTITNPPSGTTIVSSTNLVIGASAFDSDGTVTQVQFFEGSLLLGTAPSNSSAFTFNWTNAFPTPHVLTAEAWDNAGNSRISSANILYVAWDTDGDGYSDAQEIANGTNPFVPDAPWQPPAPDPSDHTPPTIFLDEPSNATLLP
ncbi:MAG: hypothetical protein EPO07_10755 [Verrucomicrobia bacterium]|nr:MAG: hypothetical protein EPO07_10755 [Verrucomicrobiota bacterium]